MEKFSEVNSSTHVAELRGFLEALQCICGINTRFTAYALNSSHEIDESLISFFSVFEKKLTLSGIIKSNYEEVKKILDKYIFSKLYEQLGLEKTKLLARQLVEYYGLISTSIDSHGSFNALISGDVFLLNINSCEFDEADYFAVKIKDTLIITGLCYANLDKTNYEDQ